MHNWFVLIFFICLCITESTPKKLKDLTQIEFFVIPSLKPLFIHSARKIGLTFHDELLAASNGNETTSSDVYDSFIEKCNIIGSQQTKKIYEWTTKESNERDYKLLIAMGMQPFAARFATLPVRKIESGLHLLCAKMELQLQCQYGFGETRDDIQWRIGDMKDFDGNVRLLLERSCRWMHKDAEIFHCIGAKVQKWTHECMQTISKFNQTKYEVGKQIADDHIAVVDQIEEISSGSDMRANPSLSSHVDHLLYSALTQITRLEGRRCSALQKVVDCVKPHLERECGRDASDIVETSLTVGHLNFNRKKQLQELFEYAGVKSSEECTKLHADN